MQEKDLVIDFEIIWKKIHQTTTLEEEELLNQWLSSDASHRKFYENVRYFYKDGSHFANSFTETKEAWEKVQAAQKKTSGPNYKLIAYASTVAACVLLMVSIFIYTEKGVKVNTLAESQKTIMPGSDKAILILDDGTVHALSSESNLRMKEGGSEIKNTVSKLEYLNSGQSSTADIKYNTLKIPRGGEFFLILSDSTKVWLNSETTIRYPVQFSNSKRDVELIGEAYFEVTQNENAPFTVSCGSQVIKVLGTRFNIEAYSDERTLVTTLVEGKIEVSLKDNPAKKLLLQPNDQSLVDVNSGHITKRVVDPNQFTAWKDGRFVFMNQTLSEIMGTLSKWYNVEVIFASENMKNLRFTGNLQRSSNLSEILDKIERTNEVTFITNENIVTIK